VPELHLDRRQRDAQRKGGHCEHGPHEEVSHAHQRSQPSQARLACPADGLAIALQHWHKDGSIIATIITTHMPRNDAAAPGHVCPHVCPGICIHASDIV